MENDEKTAQAKKGVLRRVFTFKKWHWPFFGGIGFAIFCFIGINAAMKPVSSNIYCGFTCHEMETSYTSWKQSFHGTNEKGLEAKCIDCHMPATENYFARTFFKMYVGARDMYKHLFEEYNAEEVRQKVIDGFENEMCMRCHVDLLAKPRDQMVFEVHEEILNTPDDPDSRCIECHENAAHQRDEEN